MNPGIRYREIKSGGKRYWGLLSLLALAALIGAAGRAPTMDAEGHHHHRHDQPGGLGHAARVRDVPDRRRLGRAQRGLGRLGVRPRATSRWRASPRLLAVTLLAGGLAVLMLDLGRPDRLIVAMTHYNFKSIFAWNIIPLHRLLSSIVAGLPVDDVRAAHEPLDTRPAGVAALLWRLVLTTGTGSIFGFLVAREAYDSGAAGAAVHRHVVRLRPGGVHAVLLAACRGTTGAPSTTRCIERLRSCSASSSPSSLYFVAVYHLTNLYVARQITLSKRFILL